MALKETLKTSIKSVTNFHRPDGSPNVFLFSTPRSGSTWLMELIWTQPGFKFCTSPFDIRFAIVRDYLGLSTWNQLYDPRSLPTLEKYLGSICTGKLHNLDPSPIRKYYRPLTRRIVFKVISGAEDRINWFSDRFNGRVVYLVRHPLAVSISSEVFTRLDAFLETDYRQHFTPAQCKFAEQIIESGNKLHLGVLSWCLQNAVSLRYARDDWAVISYEQLVVQPETVIHHLAKKLSLPEPQRMLDRLVVPSSVKYKSDQTTQKFLEKQSSQDRRWLVEKWRRKVSEAEERAAMEILKTFDLDIYRFGDCLPAGWIWIRETSDENFQQRPVAQSL